MKNLQIETRHLPPDIQNLVDTIINGVVALASKWDSNGGSNPPGVASTTYSVTFHRIVDQRKV